MTGVVVGVEANEVAMQDTKQEGFSDRQNPVDLTAGKGGVEEEANLDVLLAVANLFAKHLGKQHQVIVVDPDHISVLNIADDRFGEEPVYLAVCAPGRLVEGDLTGVVVE
jgi:hypothetical protein